MIISRTLRLLYILGHTKNDIGLDVVKRSTSTEYAECNLFLINCHIRSQLPGLTYISPFSTSLQVTRTTARTTARTSTTPRTTTTATRRTTTTRTRTTTSASSTPSPSSSPSRRPTSGSTRETPSSCPAWSTNWVRCSWFKFHGNDGKTGKPCCYQG